MDPRTAPTILGNRILKVDHAGEHGAICIYRAQLWISRWRAPLLSPQLANFLSHEHRHRDLFGAEMSKRGVRRCRSFHLCGVGGLILGLANGLVGPKAIAATTVAVESVVLRHLNEQTGQLRHSDPVVAATIDQIIADETEHHDASLTHVDPHSFLYRLIRALVGSSTELVIWMGMRL
jgi:ubiquinone biosynthesis monooxygenase Coq7